VFAAVAAVLIAPFLALAPHGLLASFRAQAARGLQIESLGAQLLVAAGKLGAYSVSVTHHTRGAVSYDLRGTLPAFVGAVSSALQLAAVVAITYVFVRRRGDTRQLLVSSAAAVAGFLAFTRFFSPQYLVWLIPLVLVVESVAAWALLACALALDQVWFFHYRSIVALGDRSWFVLLRDALVVALFVVLLRRAAKDEDAVAFENESPLGVRP
jgi:hypothetical protein